MLTQTFNFFYEWLFGSDVPTALESVAEPLTALISILFALVVLYTAYKLIFGLSSWILHRGR